MNRFRAGLVGLAIAATTATTVAAAPAAGAAHVVPAQQAAGTFTTTTAASSGLAAGVLALRPSTKPVPGVSRYYRVRVRSSPIHGTIRTHLYKRERITILCATLYDLRDGYAWTRVRSSRGITGWVRIDLVNWRGSAPLCH